MRLISVLAGWVMAMGLGQAVAAPAVPALDLRGYGDAHGAITVLHGGGSVDPYFAMQALLLAHDNGMPVAAPAEKFVNWLLPRQKPDGTFDRFCRDAAASLMACQSADADDSLLAMWMRLLETMPDKLARNPAWQKSHSISQASLAHLFQPSRGVYMVSPLVLHGLFMDNLEVWSLKMHSRQPAQRAEAGKLARSIHDTFWNPVDKRFLVSTQLEQRSQKAAFYPDHVAQIFPLLLDFPILPAEAKQHYRTWMAQHRSEWLNQGKADYPWGLLAVLALRQDDKATASCWLREATPLRHGARWAVTDETAYQLLVGKGLAAAGPAVACN